MASMVQIFNHPPEQREGYHNNANSAGLMASQFDYNGGAASITHIHCNEQELINGGEDPRQQAPFAPVPFAASSPACTQHDDPCSFLQACVSRTIAAHTRIPSFDVSSRFDIDFPLSEDNQLLELMGLQRKLSIYNTYGNEDHDHLSHDSIAAADQDEKESFLQACSYAGDEVTLCNLARSFTFPPAGARGCAAAPADISSCAARPAVPLILSADAEGRNPNHLDMKHNLNEKRVYRESSSAATTSCSNDDEGDLPQRTDGGVKIEVLEVSESMLGTCEQQGSIEQMGTTLSSRGCKQNRKRATNISSSNASAKIARLDTPPDVVHVRARRGQATDSHSLAERVRREKISQRMKVLQEIVPGCHKVLGKAMMLDEIINYVKSLQKQVEFLSMKLAAANQVGMPSMITNEVKFLLPNVELFGEFSSSCQVVNSESFLNSFIK